MQTIARAALRLKQKLVEEPNALSLVSMPERDKEHSPSYEKDLEMRREELDDVVQRLDAIHQRATLFSSRDNLLRSMSGAPQANDMNTPSESLYLWPHLFGMWEDCGHRVVQTAKGSPLHEFICFVHRVAGLDPPTAENVKRAAIRWQKNAQRRPRYRFGRIADQPES